MVKKKQMNLIQICKSIRILPIEEAWFLYVSALQKSKWGKKWWKWDPWQHYDALYFFWYRYIAFVRARGGSKTRDLSAMAVFLRIRGYPTFWFAAVRKQLMRAQEYWSYNPFVSKFRISINKQIIYTIEFDMIEIAVLNKGNAKGPRAAAIIYDEMAQMQRDLVDDTRGITNGMGDDLFIAYGSTPIINTVFQDMSVREKSRIHPYYHMKWFSLANIKRDKLLMSPAKWRQENLAHFTAMDGQVFEENIFRGTYKGRLLKDIYYGSDPNPREGYVVIGGYYGEEDKVFQVTFCKDFGPNARGKKAMIKFLIKQQDTNHWIGGIEIEANGVGKPVCDDAADDGLLFDAVDWTQDGKNTRVNEIGELKVFIPKGERYDKLFNQITSLQWTKDGKKVEKLKGVPYHYADSFIHTCQPIFNSNWGWV